MDSSRWIFTRVILLSLVGCAKPTVPVEEPTVEGNPVPGGAESAPSMVDAMCAQMFTSKVLECCACDPAIVFLGTQIDLLSSKVDQKTRDKLKSCISGEVSATLSSRRWEAFRIAGEGCIEREVEAEFRSDMVPLLDEAIETASTWITGGGQGDVWKACYASNIRHSGEGCADPSHNVTKNVGSGGHMSPGDILDVDVPRDGLWTVVYWLERKNGLREELLITHPWSEARRLRLHTSGGKLESLKDASAAALILQLELEDREEVWRYTIRPQAWTIGTSATATPDDDTVFLGRGGPGAFGAQRLYVRGVKGSRVAGKTAVTFFSAPVPGNEFRAKEDDDLAALFSSGRRANYTVPQAVAGVTWDKLLSPNSLGTSVVVACASTSTTRPTTIFKEGGCTQRVFTLQASRPEATVDEPGEDWVVIDGDVHLRQSPDILSDHWLSQDGVIEVPACSVVRFQFNPHLVASRQARDAVLKNGRTAVVFVVDSKDWSGDPGVLETSEKVGSIDVTVPSEGVRTRHVVSIGMACVNQNSPVSVALPPGEYDIIYDLNSDGKYTPGEDLISNPLEGPGIRTTTHYCPGMAVRWQLGDVGRLMALLDLTVTSREERGEGVEIIATPAEARRSLGYVDVVEGRADLLVSAALQTSRLDGVDVVATAVGYADSTPMELVYANKRALDSGVLESCGIARGRIEDNEQLACVRARGLRKRLEQAGVKVSDHVEHFAFQGMQERGPDFRRLEVKLELQPTGV